MSEDIRRNFLICGLGSIGKMHLQKILNVADRIIVIDPNVDVKIFLESKLPDKKVQYFDSLAKLSVDLTDFVSIVSNWGPDHFATVNHARNLNCRRFLIEKPLVSKLSDLFVLRDLAIEDSIDVISSLPWSYGNLVQKIDDLLNKYNLGEVASILVDGGAKCLVTNGIHYVGLAIKLFESIPTCVFSSLHNSFINPRQKHFLFIEGSAAWTFPNNRFLTINFVNSSHLQLSIKIVFTFGKLLIEGNIATLYMINEQDRALIDKPSRTYQASELIESFMLFDLDSRIDGLDVIYQDILDSNLGLWLDFQHGFETTEAILAMLISNEEKALIEFPLALDFIEKYKSRDWYIS